MFYPLALMLLTTSCVYASAVGESQSPITRTVIVEVVTDEVYRADLQLPWVALDLQATVVNRTLRVPANCPAVPMPDVNGRFRFDEFSRFVETEFNNSRNALRLLGLPSTCRFVDTTWIATYDRILCAWNGNPITVTVEISPDGRQVTWSYQDKAVPKPQSDKEN